MFAFGFSFNVYRVVIGRGLVGDSRDIYLYGLEFWVGVNVVDKVVMAVNNLADSIVDYLSHVFLV